MLRPIGELSRCDPSGRLPRLGVVPGEPWSSYSKSAVDQLVSSLGGNLVGIALRGSVARSRAIVGVSDLDLVVVTTDPVDEVKPIEFPEAHGPSIDMVLLTQTEFLQGKKAAWLRFHLAYSGWTVWGADIVGALPAPTLGRHAIAHLKGLARWLPDWRRMFLEETTDAGKKEVCAWVMKRSVRSVFESVMLAEGVYSRDIYPCLVVAKRCYPSHAAVLTEAAQLSVCPVADVKQLDGVMPPLTAVLHEAFQAFYGRSAPT
ncbi:hypothetical protein [Tabrizicola sp.]|uniref:hypothetical protein n=1 Tax=Tabrizicola sp. TaxID=2005166 RepID=UPI003F2A429A